MTNLPPLVDCPGTDQLPVEVSRASGKGRCADCREMIILGRIVDHTTDPPTRVLLQHLVRAVSV